MVSKDNKALFYDNLPEAFNGTRTVGLSDINQDGQTLVDIQISY